MSLNLTEGSHAADESQEDGGAADRNAAPRSTDAGNIDCEIDKNGRDELAHGSIAEGSLGTKRLSGAQKKQEKRQRKNVYRKEQRKEIVKRRKARRREELEARLEGLTKGAPNIVLQRMCGSVYY